MAPSSYDDAEQRHGPPLPSRRLTISAAVAWVLLVVVNVGSAAGWFGDGNAEVSARHPTPITPAGWAFAIWGVVFGLQGAGVVAALLSWGDCAWKRLAVGTIGYGWPAGWAFQCAWQLLFPRETLWAFCLCLACLAGALAAFATTLHRLHTLDAAAAAPAGRLAYPLYSVPTSINTAWLSVATGLGALVVAQAAGAAPATSEALAVALLAATSGVAAWLAGAHGDAAYGATLLWALSAIAAAHPEPRPTLVVTLACLAVVGVCTVLALVRRRPDKDAATLAAAAGGAGAGGQGVYDHLLPSAPSGGPLDSQLSRHASAAEEGRDDKL